MATLTFEPLALAVVGTGAVVHGLLELVLAKRGDAKMRLPLLLSAVCALLSGVALATEQLDLVWQGLALLAATELLLAGVRSSWFVGTLAAGSRWLHFGWMKYGVVQGFALLIVGGSLIASQLVKIEQDLERDIHNTDMNLGMLADPIDLPPTPTLFAQTDSGKQVPLFIPYAESVSASPAKEQTFLTNWSLHHKVIQLTPADVNYNCHGWVFTGGKFWLRGGAIEGILADNDYKAVAKPEPGDVAVFRNNLGEVTHTGLVRGQTGKQTLIESKWGQMGRYIHTADDHAYQGNEIRYYHTTRGSHLLRGLDSTPGTQAISTPAMP